MTELPLDFFGLEAWPLALIVVAFAASGVVRGGVPGVPGFDHRGD